MYRVEKDDGVNDVLGQFNVDEDSGTVTALVSLDRERDGDFLQFHVLAVIEGHQSPSHALVLVRERRGSVPWWNVVVERPGNSPSSSLEHALHLYALYHITASSLERAVIKRAHGGALWSRVRDGPLQSAPRWNDLAERRGSTCRCHAVRQGPRQSGGRRRRAAAVRLSPIRLRSAGERRGRLVRRGRRRRRPRLRAVLRRLPLSAQLVGRVRHRPALRRRRDARAARPRDCLLYTSPSPRDRTRSRMPSSA